MHSGKMKRKKTKLRMLKESTLNGFDATAATMLHVPLFFFYVLILLSSK